jgi:hypothetical protein
MRPVLSRIRGRRTRRVAWQAVEVDTSSTQPPTAVLLADAASPWAATVASLSREAGERSARGALAVQVHDELVTSRAVTKEGVSDWSQVVSLLVV